MWQRAIVGHLREFLLVYDVLKADLTIYKNKDSLENTLIHDSTKRHHQRSLINVHSEVLSHNTWLCGSAQGNGWKGISNWG